MALRLAVTKGPQQGHTLEFAPGSTVRIGRIIRGNNLTIKDSGVSSKHLSIELNLGKWVLRDLDSSNGTLFNGVAVDPGVGVELHDGDVVKIGEETSISVAIEEVEVLVPRRNPSRSCSAAAVVEAEEEVVNRRSGRPRRGRVLEEVSSEEKVLEKRVSTRQSNRRLKKEEIAVTCSVLGKILEDLEFEAEEAKVPLKTTKPRTLRRRKNAQEGLVSIDASVESDSEGNARVSVGEDRVNSCEVEEDTGQESVPIIMAVESDSEGSARVGDGEDRVEDGNACGVEKKGGSGSNDLEKMELGEWFDFLEVDFPRQIIEASEEKIRAMRLKAQRVSEYMEQLNKGKGKVPVV